MEVAGFLNDAGNAQEFNSLVEDVHEAVMNYQVRIPAPNFHNARRSNVRTRLHYNKISMMRVVCSS